MRRAWPTILATIVVFVTLALLKLHGMRAAYNTNLSISVACALFLIGDGLCDLGKANGFRLFSPLVRLSIGAFLLTFRLCALGWL